MRYSLLPVFLSALLSFAYVCQSEAECDPPPSFQTRPSSHSKASSYAQLGAWYRDHKQYACAANAYESALKLHPRSSRLSYLVGLNLFSAGDIDAAVRPLQQSIEIAPTVLEPHLVLASAFEKLDRKSEAKAEWQAALKIDPQSDTALDGLARDLLDEGRPGDVLNVVGPSRSDLRLVLDVAQADMRLKRFDDASKLIKSALIKHPSSTALTNALVRIEIQQFHYQAAEKIAERTAKLHPSDQEIQRLYLQTLILAGNNQPAIPLARKLLIDAPQDAEFLYLNGVLEHDTGNLEGARTHLEQAVAADPRNPAARYSLGQVLNQLNDAKGAKEELEKALELGATEPEVHLELAKVLRIMGDARAANQQMDHYQQELRRRQDESLAASKIAQADKEMSTGNPQKAVGLYREALEATPDNAQLNYKLAAALDLTGDLPGEQSALEKAVQINPDFAIAQNQLGVLASKNGDSQTAEKHFREAVRAAPSFTEAWVNLAATLGLESRFADAQQAVTNALRLDPKNPQALLLRDTLAKALAQR